MTKGRTTAELGMGAGGPPEGYFEKIQAVLEKYDILFVADEVTCGFGRAGNMWGSQTFNLEPDIGSPANHLGQMAARLRELHGPYPLIHVRG